MGSAQLLEGKRVLLVEDHYVVATEMAAMLRRFGAVVVGPFAELEPAMAASVDCDLALLDVNLRGAAVFPLAGDLLDRDIPVGLVTGYETAVLPPRFRDLPRVEKPVELGPLGAILRRLVPATAGDDS
jgi:DNA-binding NtrC family response regulator